MANNMHPKCNKCNSLMIVVGEENGYRIWKCPNCDKIEDDSLNIIPYWVEDDVFADKQIKSGRQDSNTACDS